MRYGLSLHLDLFRFAPGGSRHVQSRALQAIFVASAACAIVLSLHSLGPFWTRPFLTSSNLHYLYAIGLLVALHITAAAGVSGLLEKTLSPFAASVRFLGRASFPLYLVHRPVVQFVSAWPVTPPGSASQTLWLSTWVAVTTVAVTYIGEALRLAIRGALLPWFGAPVPRPAA
jgi:peptidoglycan/LPS O-acetylase OafA/YrhL